MGRVIPLRVVENGEPADLISIRDAAAIIGVTRASIYNWINEGRLRAWRRVADGRKAVRRLDAEQLGRYRPDAPGVDSRQSEAG